MRRPAGGSGGTSEDGSKQWQSWGGKVDIFHSDTVGKRADGSHVYTQVTCGQVEAVRQRRRKLETIPWHVSDTVLVLQMVETPDPAHKARKVFSFRVHQFLGNQWAVASSAITIPRAWFKAMKEGDIPERCDEHMPGTLDLKF